METRTYTVYKFHELSERAQQKAMEDLANINVDHDWWDYSYKDAENIGLEITEFDLYRQEINGNLLQPVGEVCRRIIAAHGNQCKTYRLAQEYYKKKFNKQPYDGDTFRRALLEVYRIMLEEEYNYLTGEEAIKETIKANEYCFTENGKID